MAVRFPSRSPVDSPMHRPPRAFASRAGVAAAALALLLAACSILPPSMQKGAHREAPAPHPVGPQADFGPLPPPKAEPSSQAAPRQAEADAKVYRGSGNFINPKPPAPQPP